MVSELRTATPRPRLVVGVDHSDQTWGMQPCGQPRRPPHEPVT
ncbi:hypothetical protein DFQ14_102227 [Halopolyspora algeriensis]|uniref:Uncharacterized protein n=1 Tax=Halopolyspora algeriensis TaxID=1500506 RepID=A0A368VV04_9ACTN|nr:hypothetical protein DFQ14_102227 [Halopolyspora algeriensis]TQM55339.1 hypothetical protein FHU43_0101 [Halopolyspora algeriensis]